MNIFSENFVENLSYVEGISEAEATRKQRFHLEELLDKIDVNLYHQLVHEEGIQKMASGVVFYGKEGYSRYSVLFDGTLVLDAGSTTNQGIKARAKFLGVQTF